MTLLSINWFVFKCRFLRAIGVKEYIVGYLPTKDPRLNEKLHKHGFGSPIYGSGYTDSNYLIILNR